MEQNCFNCDKIQQLNFPITCETCSNILCLTCCQDTDICNNCLISKVVEQDKLISIPSPKIESNKNIADRNQIVANNVFHNIRTNTSNTNTSNTFNINRLSDDSQFSKPQTTEPKICSCGNNIVKAKFKIFYNQDNRFCCKFCNEEICDRCREYCHKHGVKCDYCEAFVENNPINFVVCEYCNMKLCLRDRNIYFDVLSHADVCKNHALKCTSGKIVLCGEKYYKCKSYQCQYINNDKRCKDYTCDYIIQRLEINNVKNVYVCHNHLFDCFLCKRNYPMTLSKLFLNKSKNYLCCNDCYSRIETYDNCVKFYCDDNNLRSELLMLILKTMDNDFRV